MLRIRGRPRNESISTLNIAPLLAIASIAIMSSCCTVESLTFDVSSKTSSTFTSSSCSNTYQHTAILYSQSYPPTTTTSSNYLTMKVGGSSKRSRNSKASQIIELNNERLQTAGRPGTKNFIDPNKLFIGNLPYDATEADITSLFAQHWHIPLDSVGERIESIKIIKDWKTNQSKGYGFIQFYEPMIATSTMESVNKGKGEGWKINGRRIRLDQGKRKENEEEKRLKRKKKEEKKKKMLEMNDLDDEGRLIHSALEDVEGSSALANEEEEDGMSEDDMIAFIEKGGLKGVMPLTEETAGFLGIEGLYDDDDGEDDGYFFEEYYNENGYSDVDFGDDIEKDIIDGDDDGDDKEELVYDGVFEEMYNPNEYESLSDEEEAEIAKMNREQRRAAEKKRKKRKLPFKGFGSRP